MDDSEREYIKVRTSLNITLDPQTVQTLNYDECTVLSPTNYHFRPHRNAIKE